MDYCEGEHAGPRVVPPNDRAACATARSIQLTSCKQQLFKTVQTLKQAELERAAQEQATSTASTDIVKRAVSDANELLKKLSLWVHGVVGGLCDAQTHP